MFHLLIENPHVYSHLSMYMFNLYITCLTQLTKSLLIQLHYVYRTSTVQLYEIFIDKAKESNRVKTVIKIRMWLVLLSRPLGLE